MRIKKYNNFLLESLLLESQFIIDNIFRETITQIRNDNWGNIEGKVAEFILDVVGEELDLVYNYIETSTKPGLVSFIPEDKIDFSQVAIDRSRILRPDHSDNLIKAYGIPFKGLISDLQGTANDFKLLKVIDSDGKIANDKYRVRGHYFYYLQNNKDPQKFVAVYRTADSTSTLGNTNKVVFASIPEARRSEVKLGRFVNKLVDIYSKSDALKNAIESYDEVPFFDFTASDIEKFVNAYSAKILFEQNALERFKVVSGEEIRKWYDEKNYSSNSGGQLNSSCMRHSRCQKYFDIYVDNPRVCQLLILMDSTDKKILGRALLWKTESDVNFMDRVYTSKDNYMKLFKQWGEQNNYQMKSSWGYLNNKEDVVVKVKPKIYSYYPYMDTLSCYAPVKGILSNNTLDYDSYPDLKLDRTFKSIVKDIFPSNPNDSIVLNLFKKRSYKYGTPLFSLSSVSGEARPY
jgi:hypothetical protein